MPFYSSAKQQQQQRLGELEGTVSMSMKAPFLSQVYVQVSFAAMFLLTRFELTRGMSPYTFVLGRQLVATFAICPFAFFLHRPRLSLRSVAQIFLLALLGITLGQNLYYAGLSYTSTTLAATMSNLRLEEVDVRNRRSQAKIVGTVLCVGGAMVMTFARAPQRNLTVLLFNFDTKWILGAALLAAGGCAWCGFLVYQLQWDLQLLTILYSGVFCSGLGLFAQMWGVKMRGPVFTTTFNPLKPLLFHVHLQWGSLVGMVMIIGGLYCMLWGKAIDGNTR